MYNIDLSFCVVVHLIMFEITALEFEEKSVQLSKACIRMHAFPKKQASEVAVVDTLGFVISIYYFS